MSRKKLERLSSEWVYFAIRIQAYLCFYERLDLMPSEKSSEEAQMYDRGQSVLDSIMSGFGQQLSVAHFSQLLKLLDETAAVFTSYSKLTSWATNLHALWSLETECRSREIDKVAEDERYVFYQLYIDEVLEQVVDDLPNAARRRGIKLADDYRERIKEKNEQIDNAWCRVLDGARQLIIDSGLQTLVRR